MKVKSVFSAPARTAPLFCQYDGQIQPQPAYITLDLSTGHVDADYFGSVGGGVSMAVCNGIVRRYRVPSDLSTEQVHNIIGGAMPVLQAILLSGRTEWRDGIYKGILTEEGRELERKLENDHLPSFYYESEVITDLADWLTASGDDSAWLPRHGDSIDDFVKNLIEDIESDGYIIADTSATVEETLLELWAEHLYAGYPLPSNVAQVLINTRFCANSQWTYELECYARGEVPESSTSPLRAI